jgi:hypothetical protein
VVFRASIGAEKKSIAIEEVLTERIVGRSLENANENLLLPFRKGCEVVQERESWRCLGRCAEEEGGIEAIVSKGLSVVGREDRYSIGREIVGANKDMRASK